MDTSQGVNPSTSLALRPPVGFDPSGKDVLFLGKELEIDLWLKAQTKVAQSILIRTTTPEGRVRSAFMHVDGSISQVPLFDSEDPLVLDEKVKLNIEFQALCTNTGRKKYRHNTTDMNLCNNALSSL